MKLSRIYDLCVSLGTEKDPRTKQQINNQLKSIKRMFNRLNGVDKKVFDKEKLRQPYSDTRILYGNPEKEIKTIMVGVDIETPELLLGDRLTEKGLAVDLMLSHHPEGVALSNFYEVMQLHKNVLMNVGIKKEIADSLIDERIKEVSRSVSSRNHSRSVDAAKYLDMAFMCVHTPADNYVANYLQSLFDKKKPSKVKDALNLLKSIPEFRIGAERGAGPRLIAGAEKNDACKVFVEMTGGTEGSDKVFARLSQAGINTIVAMHLSEAHFKKAKAEHINVIVAGHIASDNLGLNLLLDDIQRKGKEEFNILECSGFVRIKER
ncbi:MAG: NGG1p interacting factor NIF3 [Candidatus Omnitrophica bacterium]|nr:NGG1p interacting factor NIF3 [Candidatus Omnitrophota bacterium]